MNRRIGTLFLTALAFSVLWNPGTANSPARPPTAVNAAEEVSPIGQATLSTTRPPATSNTAEFVSTQCLPDCPAQDLFDAVQELYGTRGQIDDDTLKHLGIPAGERDKVEYLVALVADPVHTHLSLFFDRTVDALQQGVQQSNYLFSRATIPWDNQQHPESTDWHLRLSQKKFERAQAALPGLMIFRKANPGSKDDLPHVLFVFVVGETPTGGIHRDQFHNALEAMRQMSKNGEPTGGHPTLRILGPTFSGSLYSLVDIANKDSAFFPSHVPIYSGTVSSAETVDWFNQYPDKLPSLRFLTFQESDRYAIARFIAFAAQQGYPAKSIVLLSEDETAYGCGSPKLQPTVKSII
jgi:hypothetical protein